MTKRLLKKTMKFQITACLLVIVLYFQVLPVCALSEDYVGEITPEMEESGVLDSDEDLENNRIMVSQSVSYDAGRDQYCYGTDNGTVYCSALDGMLTQDDVTIAADKGVEIKVYLDGKESKLNDSGTVSKAGDYMIKAVENSGDTRLVSFKIIGKYLGDEKTYELPSGCIANALTRDGKDVLEDDREISFEKEGHYVLNYQCVKNGITYTLDCTADYTAPKIKLSGVTKNKAKGPVEIKNVEEGANIEIKRDGKKVTMLQNRLTYPGSYEVTVSDAAGNARTYQFYILFYLNTGTVSFGIVFLLSVVAVGIYLIITRKRLRVR